MLVLTRITAVIGHLFILITVIGALIIKGSITVVLFAMAFC